MDDLFLEKNISIVHRRWPALLPFFEEAVAQPISIQPQKNTLIVDDIQLTSNYDRETESQLQSLRVPQSSQQACIYGTGLGDLPIALLKRKKLQKLNICILNFKLFLYVLNHFDQSGWLNDNRVELFSYHQIKEVYHPFCCSPSELILADLEASQLRDRLFLEIETEYLSKSHQKSNMHVQQSIVKNLEFIQKDPDISSLLSIRHHDVFIAATGPTLSEHLDWLVEQKKAFKLPFVIALDASLKPLMHKGIVPNVVVSIDAKADFLFEDLDFNALKNTHLVYFPRVKYDVLKKWRGPRYCSYSSGDLYDEVKSLYPKKTLFSAGSVIHPAVDLAVKMKPKNIILLGADFSFVGEKGHTYWQSNQSYLKNYQDSEHTHNHQHWLINSLGEKVPTMANLKGYLRDLERYIQSHSEVVFLNGSDKGAKIEGVKLWSH